MNDPSPSLLETPRRWRHEESHDAARKRWTFAVFSLSAVATLIGDNRIVMELWWEVWVMIVESINKSEVLECLPEMSSGLVTQDVVCVKHDDEIIVKVVPKLDLRAEVSVPGGFWVGIGGAMFAKHRTLLHKGGCCAWKIGSRVLTDPVS